MNLVLALATIIACTSGADAASSPPGTTAVSKGDAEKFLVFFSKLADDVIADKTSCPKMAIAINALIDANTALIAKSKGGVLPAAIQDQVNAQSRRMMPALQGCMHDAKVQAAFQRLEAPAK